MQPTEPILTYTDGSDEPVSVGDIVKLEPLQPNSPPEYVEVVSFRQNSAFCVVRDYEGYNQPRGIEREVPLFVISAEWREGQPHV